MLGHAKTVPIEPREPNAMKFGALVDLGESQRARPARFVEGSWIRRCVPPPELGAFMQLVRLQVLTLREGSKCFLDRRAPGGGKWIVEPRAYQEWWLWNRAKSFQPVQNPPEPNKVRVRPGRPYNGRRITYEDPQLIKTDRLTCLLRIPSTAERDVTSRIDVAGAYRQQLAQDTDVGPRYPELLCESGRRIAGNNMYCLGRDLFHAADLSSSIPSRPLDRGPDQLAAARHRGWPGAHMNRFSRQNFYCYVACPEGSPGNACIGIAGPVEVGSGGSGPPRTR